MARSRRRTTQAAPQEVAPDSPVEEPAEEAEEETPAETSEAEQSEVSTPTTIRTGRRGRPRKILRDVLQRSTAASPEPDAADEEEVSEPGTPTVQTPSYRGRRGRGRPPASARGYKNRGGPSHVTAVPKDEEGNIQEVENDEIVLPIDPAGEKKVDALGNLKGGREYRCRTFTVKGRGERLYMLSTEPARCMGFRDSYLLFQRHKKLYKIIVDEDEKYDMIARKLIPHSYKGRAIGIVTARSIFREFGAKIIIGGRNIIDDYYEAEARAAGFVEGELADPNDKLPSAGEAYNKNQYVAWHGASAVYHTGQPTVPTAAAAPRKKRTQITSENWMLEHASSARAFDAALLSRRKHATFGVYEQHTNLMHYPAGTQPAVAKFFKVLDKPSPIVTYGRPVQVVETVEVVRDFNYTGLSSVEPDILEALVKEFGEDADCVKAAREQIRKEKEYEAKFL